MQNILQFRVVGSFVGEHIQFVFIKEKAAKACGCERSECVVFEDAFTGLQTGRDSGIFTIGLSMSNGREAIADKCDFVLDGYQNVTYETIVQARKIV